MEIKRCIFVFDLWLMKGFCFHFGMYGFLAQHIMLFSLDGYIIWQFVVFNVVVVVVVVVVLDIVAAAHSSKERILPSFWQSSLSCWFIELFRLIIIQKFKN